MKQKGVATVVIAVIVIVVVAVVGVVAAVLLMGGGGGPGGISVPAGFSETSKTTENNVTVTTYTGSGTAADATSSFKTSFQNAGWTSKGSGSVFGYSGEYFEKGNEYGVIYVYESAGQVVIIVAVGPKTAEGIIGGGAVGVIPSSVDFTLSGYQVGDLTGTIRVRARKLGTANPDYRVEVTADTGGAFIYNSTESALYSYDTSGDKWYKYTGAYALTVGSAYGGIVTAGKGWVQTYGATNFSVSYAGYTIQVTNVSVDPTISDDVFSPPAGATIEEISF